MGSQGVHYRIDSNSWDQARTSTGLEETVLGEFIEVVGQIGYGKTRKQIKNIAESVARDKGILKRSRISDGWFRRFLQRQPNLRLRKGDATASVRMDAMEDKG